MARVSFLQIQKNQPMQVSPIKQSKTRRQSQANQKQQINMDMYNKIIKQMIVDRVEEREHSFEEINRLGAG